MPACRRNCTAAPTSMVRGATRSRRNSWATRCGKAPLLLPLRPQGRRGRLPREADTNTFVRCGSLFTGREDEAQQGGALVFDGEGRLLYAGAEAGAPRRAKADQLLDYSGCFVM